MKIQLVPGNSVKFFLEAGNILEFEASAWGQTVARMSDPVIPIKYQYHCEKREEFVAFNVSTKDMHINVR